MVVCPLAVAVQVHHTEAPPKLPAMNGSPERKSCVAPTLLPVVVTIGPVKGMALPKLSLAGAADTVRGANRAKETTLTVQIRVFMRGVLMTFHTVMRNGGVKSARNELIQL